MENNGYVKLPRNFFEWEWFDDANTLKVYLALLCLAAFKDCRLKGHALKRGQAPVSYELLARHTNLNIKNVRTALKHLEMTGEIELEHTNKFTIVTVRNYDCNAGSGDFFDPQGAGDGQAVEFRASAERTSIDSQSAEVEEVEEVKEKKEGEKVEEAAPPSTVTRACLIDSYGLDNVTVYEQKFRDWSGKKGISGIEMYSAIAKWMREDGVIKRSEQNSSINYDSVISRLKDRYRNLEENG